MIFNKIDQIMERVHEHFPELNVTDNDFKVPAPDEYPICYVIPSATNTVPQVRGVNEQNDLITIMLFESVSGNEVVGDKRRAVKALFDDIADVISSLNFMANGQISYIETVADRTKVTGVKLTIRM